MEDPFTFDITEIDGFDNLHHAEGILREAQQRAAVSYGSSETHFLINGSTAGILAAIGTCCPSGRILLARNSHKAAYHSILLNRLEAVYVYPEETDPAFNGPIRAEDIERILQQVSDIRGVFITSPTYDGVVSDVERIAAIVHRYGIPLIVDEAHGAHFGRHSMFPETSVKLGADIVIHSVHKTLPSLTQTALLHVNGSLVDRRRLRKLLGVYQTSSPSYVLMSSIDQCIRMLEEQGEQLFQELEENLSYFYRECSGLQVLRLIRTDDPSKIILSAGDSGWSGRTLGERLRKEYHLEVEMEAVDYVLALACVGDDREGFVRLAEAVRELDLRCQREKAEQDWCSGACEAVRNSGGTAAGSTESSKKKTWQAALEKEEFPGIMTIYEAENASVEKLRLEESVGRISGEFIYLYPPGIPLVVPGEPIKKDRLEQLLEAKRLGYSLQGLEDYSMENIWVIQERKNG